MRAGTLVLGAAASLVGCVRGDPDPGAGSPSAVPATAPPVPASPTPSPSASPAPSPSPSSASTPGGVSREQIVSSYAGRSPAWFDLAGEGIVSTTGAGGVCLTLDACGGPGGSQVDEALIDVLLGLGVPFTAFLNSRWVEANPGATGRLVDSGVVEIANHGTAHLPLSVSGQSAYGIAGTADAGAVYDEIMGSQRLLMESTGATPRFFRPGTAHWDDVAVAIAGDLGLMAAGFSVNGDAGATLSGPAVAAEVEAAGAGDVVISHMNQPGSGTREGYELAIPRMLEAGTVFLTLSAALGLS